MNSGPIQLNFPKRTRFAGELLLGSVDINVKEAQQDEIDHVRVRIRGSLQTKIKRSNGKTTTTYRSNVPLIRIDIPLWQRGKAFPPPGTHILTVPFKYRLPADLPPSFHAKSSRKQGVVTYFLEVVATRPGMFQSNRRVRAMIAVVPAGIPEHVTLRNDLAGGWSPHMPWKTYVSDAAIRTGIWADYSHVKVVVRVFSLTSPVHRRTF
ncbi:hypothetical protein PUNSTDRAFT_74072 [Punctularia strigosozonata HHB-11173 SS5]|uniref:uncharacterized protein n=1 Tax=Punctularia strigosozonata (strain HHB-11173) TaxID=741275 RepID=UPI00044186D0|nr:uncharacterized protein PUNSTDRAFT_74072 [Punctularia strigosozonata HHB-11173 SS5]EIN05809.1 hypothetical protein PUNSTDRAFT_74072 [Punctularia strigosozonata HHB-11173 SS5]